MAGKFDDAIKIFSEVLALQPEHSEARERLRVASARKDEASKLELFRQRAAQEPNNGSAQDSLGQAYAGAGMYAEAERAYLKAVSLEPKNHQFQVRLCVNYSEWSKYDEAVACYHKAIELKPHHVLFMSLGNVYQKQGKMDEAIVAYQKSLELKPDFVFSLYSLGYVYMRQGRYEPAIPPLQKLLGIEPKHVFGNHALGVAYAQTGNRTGAMQQYYLLQTLDARLAADLLKLIPK